MKLELVALPEADQRLLASALRPSAVEVHIDQSSLDRLFLVRFEDGSAVTIRVAPLELQAILRDLSRTTAQAMN